jgi:hypothetical protein
VVDLAIAHNLRDRLRCLAVRHLSSICGNQHAVEGRSHVVIFSVHALEWVQ